MCSRRSESPALSPPRRKKIVGREPSIATVGKNELFVVEERRQQAEAGGSTRHSVHGTYFSAKRQFGGDCRLLTRTRHGRRPKPKAPGHERKRGDVVRGAVAGVVTRVRLANCGAVAGVVTRVRFANCVVRPVPKAVVGPVPSVVSIPDVTTDVVPAPARGRAMERVLARVLARVLVRVLARVKRRPVPAPALPLVLEWVLARVLVRALA